MLVDITKDAQQASCEVDWAAAEPHLTEAYDEALPGDGDYRDAVELINTAERPLILAGHGIMQSGAERDVLLLAERAGIPIAVTLLGIGGIPASHPLNLGMMGMHGEAFVNHAIQQADLLIALGMRFDDRVTGNLKTYARTAKKIHVDIDRAELNKNVRVDVAIAKDLRAALDEWLPLIKPGDRRAWLETIDVLKGDSAVRDIQNLPDNGHLYAAHVINDLWRLTGGDAVVVTDVGQHQMWEAQYYKHDAVALAHHVGRPGHDGLRAAGGDRRQGGAARRRSLGGGRRRRVPDDDVRAGDDRSGRARRQRRDHQQRLSRDGPAVAGVLLREALRGDAAHRPGLHEARAGVSASTPWRSRSAARWPPRCRARANRGAPRSSTSRSSRRIRCTRWCRPAPTCTR